MVQHANGCLINERDPAVTGRIKELGRTFTAILPTILTHDLLLHCESHPDDFVTAVGLGLERLGSKVVLIESAKRFIQEHMTEELSLGHVAQAMRLGYFYFCKFFKKHTGLHFTAFVSKVRIEKAKTLLLNPHYTVHEVASQIGFKSQAHFNRMFLRFVGESPRQYRKRLGIKGITLPQADIRTFARVR